jgi:hypothetical protein
MRADGAPDVPTGLQASLAGEYRPPVASDPFPESPPHTIISEPVHVALWNARPIGAPAVKVASQLSVAGEYRPPVPAKLLQDPDVQPPQTIISEPVQTAVWFNRPPGTPV